MIAVRDVNRSARLAARAARDRQRFGVARAAARSSGVQRLPTLQRQREEWPEQPGLLEDLVRAARKLLEPAGVLAAAVGAITQASAAALEAMEALGMELSAQRAASAAPRTSHRGHGARLSVQEGPGWREIVEVAALPSGREFVELREAADRQIREAFKIPADLLSGTFTVECRWEPDPEPEPVQLRPVPRPPDVSYRATESRDIELLAVQLWLDQVFPIWAFLRIHTVNIWRVGPVRLVDLLTYRLDSLGSVLRDESSGKPLEGRVFRQVFFSEPDVAVAVEVARQRVSAAELEDLLSPADHPQASAVAHYAHLTEGPAVSALRARTFELHGEAWRLRPFVLEGPPQLEDPELPNLWQGSPTWTLLCTGVRTHRNIERELAWRYQLSRGAGADQSEAG